jgi:uncharacterized membrane protein YebE (DUF533 family)
MDEALIFRSVLGSLLGGRARKRSRGAMRYLTGHSSSMWSHPSTLLAAAGVAWGIYDTLTNKESAPSTSVGSTGFGGLGTASVPPPPLPGAGVPPPGVSGDALRLVRLAISAANADGVMNEHERAAVTREAQAAGVGQIVEGELQQRRPLAEIVTGVDDQAQRATLYVLAFTILRADEQLTGAERIYLAQLAHLLHLDRATVERLEKDTGERIDALGDQGQLGG